MADAVSSEKPESFRAARLLTGAAWLWLLVALPLVTDVLNWWALLLLAGVGFFLGFNWVTRTVTQPSLLRRRAFWWWLSVPLAGALALWLTGDRGLALRIYLCEDSLNRHVAAAPQGTTPEETPHWVGLFQVEKTVAINGSVYLYVQKGFLDWCGIAYIPPGQAPAGKIRVRHLYGNWFEWRF